MKISEQISISRHKTPSTNHSFLSSPAFSPSSTGMGKLNELSVFDCTQRLKTSSCEELDNQIFSLYFNLNQRIAEANKNCTEIIQKENKIIASKEYIISKQSENIFSILLKNNSKPNNGTLRQNERNILRIEQNNQQETQELNSIMREYFESLKKLDGINAILKKTLEKIKRQECLSNRLYEIQRNKEKIKQKVNELEFKQNQLEQFKDECSLMQKNNNLQKELLANISKNSKCKSSINKNIEESVLYQEEKNQLIQKEIKEYQILLENKLNSNLLKKHNINNYKQLQNSKDTFDK